jgi:hypothetical protein
MKQFTFVLIAAVALSIPAFAQSGANPFVGRWDLTVTAPDATYPSWLEVVERDGKLEVRAQQREGNVRPVAAAERNGANLVVTVAAATPARPATDNRPASPGQPALVWELTAAGGKLTGAQKRGDRVQGQLSGVRAPELKRAAPAAWTAPEPLFNGKDLTGWTTVNNTSNPRATESHWSAKDGELVNEAQGRNIVTTRKFDDFKLHVEFNLAQGANSGIYLRGRYEAQMPPPAARPGGGSPGYAIYGFVSAIAGSPCKAGDWCSFDITLVGRNVTMQVNGVTIVDNQEIPGITGGALDSNEGEPGPIYFQGDHTGGIRYRNITIAVPRR